MSESRRARLFVVEDHPMMLFGLQKYLEDRYDVVGSASEVQPAIDLILERQPDLVLLDVRIPGGGGALVAESVKKANPEIKLLAFTVSTNANDVRRMLEAGVDGYVVKKTEGFELMDQIDLALAGGKPMSRYVANYSLQIDDVAASTSELVQLTPKEREVVTLIARGFKYKEVANELAISVKTLETHMAHIFNKLGVASRHEVTRIAFESGFVDPDDAAGKNPAE
jgi:DNA-binding NarL/FixJ family response regulator